MTGGANILKVFRIIPDVDPTNTTDKFSGTLQVILCHSLRNSFLFWL